MSEIEKFGRVPYAPIPYELRDASKDAMRALAKGDTQARAVWHVWRMATTEARSKNESILATLLWAAVTAEYHGDTFAADTIRAWLADEWNVPTPPLRDTWGAFCARVCATGHPWWLLAPDGRQAS